MTTVVTVHTTGTREHRVGDYVQCGSAGAIWQVHDGLWIGSVQRLTLHSVDIHMVPLDAVVHEVPVKMERPAAVPMR